MINALSTIYFAGVLLYLVISIGVSQMNNLYRCNLNWDDILEIERLEAFIWPFIGIGLFAMGLAQLIRLAIYVPTMKIIRTINPVTSSKENADSKEDEK